MKKFSKNRCHIWNHPLEITVIAKFVYKTKTSKYQTKNVCFQYFGAWTWKQYCHVWNQQPRICLIAKFCSKRRMPRFGTKNALFWCFLLKKFCKKAKMSKFGTKNGLFGYFWVRILEDYCHIWNQHPPIV